MVESFVEAYPWDLTAATSDDLLARLHGEAGVTGVCVWAAGRPTTTFRVRPVEPRVFRSRGGLYFQPSSRAYDPTRCRPPVSSWTHDGERFERIVTSCQQHGLALRVMISASAVGRMAERYPEFAACNVFGVESVRSLCLNHPEVQEYVAALVADLSSQFEPKAVVFDDFSVGWHEACDPQLLNPAVPAAARVLLGICFCQSCRRQAEEAGIDVERAAGRVEQALENLLHGDATAGELASQLHDAHEPPGEYLRSQAERLTGLLRRLVADSETELLVVRPAGSVSNGRPWAVAPGVPGGILSQACDGPELEALCIGDAGRNELRIAAPMQAASQGPEFVSTVHRASSIGFSAVQIDHLGVLSDAGLAAVKQAVRYARRAAEPVG